MRQLSSAVPADFDVLARCVENLQHFLIIHQIEEGSEVDAGGDGVDHHCFIRAGDLDDAEDGVIGRLAQEFGIDGNEGITGEAGAGGRQFFGCRDRLHERLDSPAFRPGQSRLCLDKQGRACASPATFQTQSNPPFQDRPCIATAPIIAARFAKAMWARMCAWPAGATAFATTAGCCSSTCATITGWRR